MTEALIQHDLIIRYLLGVASDTECRAVEEQLFANDAGLDVLLQAEDELIDDYVRNALTSTDRVLFEGHFLSTAARRQRLKTAQSLVEALIQTEHKDLPVSDETLTSSQAGPPSERAGLAQTQEWFSNFLHWLDPDVNRAGEKYERIRDGLIRMFVARKFDNPEGLADRTIDRVLSKPIHFLKEQVKDPAAYFLGVARAVSAEQMKQRTAKPLALELIVGTEDVPERSHHCLEKCLGELAESDRDLVLQFYRFEKGNRLELANRLGITPNALRLRVYKIRRVLEHCIAACLEKQ